MSDRAEIRSELAASLYADQPGPPSWWRRDPEVERMRKLCRENPDRFDRIYDGRRHHRVGLYEQFAQQAGVDLDAPDEGEQR